MTSKLATVRVDHTSVKKSQSWFNDQVKALKTITPRMLSNDSNNKITTRVKPGDLYFFHYDPKFKDTLPYYDTFPMVFPFKAMPDGFLGLNLHYLGYKERMALFDKLLKITGKPLDEKTKMKYSWSMVNAMSNLADHCVKHYLYEHVTSPYIRVKPEDWTTCMLLPVEQFVGARKEYIWKQAR